MGSVAITKVEVKNMGIRISLAPVACVGVWLFSSACVSVDEPPGEQGEQVGQVQQKSVFQAPKESDTLAVYAARCDAATGIHVPAFSCTQGTPTPAGTHFTWIDQKTSIDNITESGQLVSVGTASGDRTPTDVAVTAKKMVSTGANISGNADNFRFAYVPMLSGAGAVEVKIVNYEQVVGVGARAGVMLRSEDPAVDNDEFSAADAPHVTLSISPAGTVRLLSRATKGAQTSELASVTGKTFPIWLRLSWEGALGTKAEISTNHDPASWQQIGIAPLSPPIVAAGVAVASSTINYDRFYTDSKCDAPSALGGSCDLKSTFQVLARTADAIAVANCRSEGNYVQNGYFSDIAVIQYNRKNGALCFYQSDLLDDDSENGVSVPAPSDTSGNFEWLTPAETHAGECTGCHDTGGLIRSPYLKQTGLLPAWGDGFDNDGNNPLRYVGHDFQNDRSYTVQAPNYDNPDPNKPDEYDGGGNCRSCHLMAVNDVSDSRGTSMLFAVQATSEFQLGDPNDVPHKNPHSATSPVWMRPSYDSVLEKYVYPAAYDEFAEATAFNFKACGNALLLANGNVADGDEWDLSDLQTQAEGPLGQVTIDCSYEAHGEPYSSPIQILQDIQWGNGGSSSGTLDNVKIASGAGTDIFNNADTGVLAQTLVAPGDGTAMVKVTSLKKTKPYAKAGLMFRAGPEANAANVMIAYTAEKGATFQYRPSTNAATPQPVFLSNITTLPVWLRLDRSGETFAGYVSTDNRATWQQVGQPITLPGYSGSIVGLVNTAHSESGEAGEAEFEAFDFTHGYGWAEPTDPHRLMDARVGGGTGSRTEWITREYIHAGGNNATGTPSGGDISNNADKFYYSFRTFQGNGELLTTVESLTSTAQWGKAGLMMRDGIGDTAKNVFVGKTPGGVTFQYRNSTGGITTANNVTTPNQPTDFRLVRSGATGLTFTAYYKLHGTTNWTQLGSRTFSSFNPKALTGLAVSTQTASATTDAVFYSGRRVEPPAFLWPDLQPDPDPDPPSSGGPCDSLCSPTSTFPWSSGSYNSGQLGTGAICLETTHAVAGGNCSNLFNGRQLQVNDVTQTCNGQNWSSVPAPRNGGYCIELSAGERWDAAFALW